MREYRRRAGDVVGRWTLTEPLGTGANAEVWEATSESGVEVAVKILHKRDAASEPYRRFANEVRVLQELGSHEGVLPLVDSHLPEVPSRDEPAWLATPVARTIRDALVDTDVQEAVLAVNQYASTLATLSERGIHHRDVKPENLFKLQDSYVVGDFGLVSDPGNEPLTEERGRLGPRYYIAPEMLDHAGTAEGEPADVYSLTKTLFVLTAGQQFPPPGEQRVDTVGVRISDFVALPRVELLDRLAERGTRYSPADRPTLREFSQELAAWLDLQTGPTHSTPADLSEIRARITRHTAQTVRAREVERTAEAAFGEIYNGFLPHLRELEEQIDTAGVPAKLQSSDVFYKGFIHRGTVTDGSLIIVSDGAAVVGLAAEFGPSLFAGFGLRAYDDGEIQIAAGYMVGSMDWPQNEVFVRHEKFAAGSARQAQMISELHQDMRDHLVDGLTRIAELIEREAQGES
ncbi:MAG: protein kinase [Actinomycetota bacterium]